MFELLKSTPILDPVTDKPYSAEDLCQRIVLSIVAGFLVAGLRWIYGKIVKRPADEIRGMPLTLVLLAGLVAVGTLVIGSNTARAFGLVGALSIVRFRTAVEDTSDTAFVIFSVTLGMGLGAGFLMLAYVSFPVLTAATFIMAFVTRERRTKRSGTVKVRLALGQDANTLLLPVLKKYDANATMTELETGNKGAAMDYTFSFRFGHIDEAAKLLAEINKIEGVQSADIKLQKG
jgi:Domain of unknown function (DUF4956)